MRICRTTVFIGLVDAEAVSESQVIETSGVQLGPTLCFLRRCPDGVPSGGGAAPTRTGTFPSVANFGQSNCSGHNRIRAFQKQLKVRLSQILAQSLFFKAPYVWDVRWPRPGAK